jgi:hypothetical protein
MRLILSLSIGALALTGLSACNRQSDEAVRNTFRTAALAGCQRGDSNARAQMASVGLSLDELCTCALDRYLATATVDQLRQNPPSAEAMQRVQAASMQCAQEMMSRANPTPGAAPGAAPTTGEAPAAPPTEAPAPAEGGAEATENHE